MSQNRKRKSEGGSEGRKKTERASWIAFVLFEKQRYDLFSWGLVLFFTFASQNRIRQAEIRKEYQWSKLHDYLYSYLYLRRTRRQSPSVDPHSFPLVLFSPQPSSPLSRFLTNRLEISNSNMKWHNKTCFISLYPSSSFRTRLSRRTEKFIRLFRIAAYHGMKRYSSWYSSIGIFAGSRCKM